MAGAVPPAAAAPVEIELKLRVAAGDVPRLRARLARLDRVASVARVQLEATYFDTPDRLLGRHRMAVRLRREQPLPPARSARDGTRDAAGAPATALPAARVLQTLKTADAAMDPLSRRGEWELPAPDDGSLDLAAWHHTPLASLLREHPGAVLAPVFSTRFVREARTVQFEGATLEVALDQGEVVVGAPVPQRRARAGAAPQRAPIRELEIEVKRGPAGAALTLARRLTGAGRPAGADLALLPDACSKAQRGASLADRLPSAPTKAAARGFTAGLTARMPLQHALRRVIAHGTHVLLANVDGVVAAADPEFIHQARVALRRMRTAVWLVRRNVGIPAPLGDGLKWLSAALGRARDADVLVHETLPELRATLVATGAPLEPALQSVERAAQRAAQRQRAAVRTTLASARFALLVLDLLIWSGTDDRAPADAADEGAPAAVAAAALPAGVPTGPAATATPALARFGRKRVRRLTRRLLQDERGFAQLSVQGRHRVRIRAKRLRYAFDLFVTVWPRRRRPVLKALRDLQDALGALNDAAVARAALARLRAGAALQAAAEARWATTEDQQLARAADAFAALRHHAR